MTTETKCEDQMFPHLHKLKDGRILQHHPVGGYAQQPMPPFGEVPDWPVVKHDD